MLVKEFTYKRDSNDVVADEEPRKATITSKEEEKEIKSIKADIKEGKPVLAREEAKANGKRAKMANWE